MPSDQNGSPGSAGQAVVLGAGGVVGTAWMAGLIGGVRRHGLDLAAADLILGTSAGAIVGAMLAAGQDFGQLAVLPPPAGPGRSASAVDPGRMAEVFAVLGDPRLEPAEARRRAGQLALAAGTGPEQEHIARMGSLITARDWPDRALLIIAVDAETSEPVAWDRTSGVPLLSAVAASCAMPGAYPPITINGSRCIDGGLRSATNADLARDARSLVVVEPLAHLFPREPPDRDGPAGAVTAIAPDPAALAAFGPDLLSLAAWEGAYQAGAQQAAGAAERIRSVGWQAPHPAA